MDLHIQQVTLYFIYLDLEFNFPGGTRSKENELALSYPLLKCQIIILNDNADWPPLKCHSYKKIEREPRNTKNLHHLTANNN